MYLLNSGKIFIINANHQSAINKLMIVDKRFFKASSILLARHQNYYQILGVKTNVSDKEIKQAYFKLAKKYHPDLNPNHDARHKFEAVKKAYETLSDDSKREAYDSQMGFGRASFQDFYQQGQESRGKASGVYSDDEYESIRRSDKRTKPFRSAEENWQHDAGAAKQFWRDVENKEEAFKQKEEFAKRTWDEFDDFFQFNENQEATRDDTKGQDYKVDIEIDFMEAVKGGIKTVEMNKRVICPSCKGTRAKQGSQPRKCYECGGRGSVIGNYGIRKKCKKCNGAGCIVRQPCHDCEGLGVVRQTLSEEVELPQGLSNDQKIKIRGLGHASDVFHGMPGDLLLHVKVKDHPIFIREGQNIISEITLSLSEALLGCKFTIDTIDGKINIELQPGVNEGDELVLKNMGIPHFHADDHSHSKNQEERGDHILRFKVKIPQNLTQRQKELLNQFQHHEYTNRDKFYEQIRQELIEKEKEKQEKAQSKQQEQQQQSNNQQNTKSHKEGGFFSKIKGIFS